MGWRFRKSINLGLGFRINLSKSGIGYSWGVPGYRVTKMANGGNRTTFSIPGTGISYVDQTGKNYSNEDIPYTGEIENYKNIPIEEIQNNDPILKKVNRVLFLNRISNIMLFLTLGISYHPSFILFLFAGLGIKIYISMSKKIGLYYEFDDESRKMYSSLKEAIIKLSNNKKMWQVTTSTKVYNTKYNAGATNNIERNNAYITSKMPWYIKTNIEIYGLNLRNQKMFFTPDRVIVFQPFRKAFGCTYNDMELLISYTNFIESERVYGDSEIVNYTWRYANTDGGRDLRFSNNKKYPICKYGKLTIESPQGINTIIHFSNCDLVEDIKTNLIMFGNNFNKILSKTKNKKEPNETIVKKESKEKVKQINKVKDITENKVEYKIPDISLIKDEQSKTFIDFYNKLNKKDKIEIPIGVSKKGEVIEKINDMPNLLIGGTVMSGKTTFINSIISSILLTKKPNEVKLIIFDSKKVDYLIFKEIPHLLAPIINDSKRLNVALKRILDEIERRFELLENANVKSISRYNSMITNGNEKVPDILIIIDDLNSLNDSEEINKKIEDITANGWNANVYMIVASNYPSAQILSTISKSNFPARLSFKVTSTKASQIIINDTGAEKLSGVGNALYTSRLNGNPIQITVPYITEDDIKNIVNNLEGQYKKALKNDFDNEKDDKKESAFVEPLYDEIVDFVVSSRKASASLLQRRFRFGYNRAANAIDLLEERGIIGPQIGSKPREVLVNFESEDE